MMWWEAQLHQWWIPWRATVLPCVDSHEALQAVVFWRKWTTTRSSAGGGWWPTVSSKKMLGYNASLVDVGWPVGLVGWSMGCEFEEVPFSRLCSAFLGMEKSQANVTWMKIPIPIWFAKFTGTTNLKGVMWLHDCRLQVKSTFWKILLWLFM